MKCRKIIATARFRSESTFLTKMNSCSSAIVRLRQMKTVRSLTNVRSLLIRMNRLTSHLSCQKKIMGTRRFLTTSTTRTFLVLNRKWSKPTSQRHSILWVRWLQQSTGQQVQTLLPSSSKPAVSSSRPLRPVILSIRPSCIKRECRFASFSNTRS